MHAGRTLAPCSAGGAADAQGSAWQRETGLRKLHPSGVLEARVGLGLRLVFTFAAGTPTLVRLGSHDEIWRRQ